MEVNGHQKLFATNILQNIFYRFGSTWWLNDDRIFIFGWTIPLALNETFTRPLISHSNTQPLLTIKVIVCGVIVLF